MPKYWKEKANYKDYPNALLSHKKNNFVVEMNNTFEVEEKTW
jgi:hypothetical protein